MNILRAAFTHADPESAKKTDNLTAFYVIRFLLLLLSARAKAASRMLMKLSIGNEIPHHVHVLWA